MTRVRYCHSLKNCFFFNVSFVYVTGVRGSAYKEKRSNFMHLRWSVVLIFCIVTIPYFKREFSRCQLTNSQSLRVDLHLVHWNVCLLGLLLSGIVNRMWEIQERRPHFSQSEKSYCCLASYCCLENLEITILIIIINQRSPDHPNQKDECLCSFRHTPVSTRKHRLCKRKLMSLESQIHKAVVIERLN